MITNDICLSWKWNEKLKLTLSLFATCNLSSDWSTLLYFLVGKWYSKESIYKKDFDRPEQRHGTKNLKNPNWDHFEPFDPFGAQGGGAPLYDNGGQRNTKIRGTMRYIGREVGFIVLYIV